MIITWANQRFKMELQLQAHIMAPHKIPPPQKRPLLAWPSNNLHISTVKNKKSTTCDQQQRSSNLRQNTERTYK